MVDITITSLDTITGFDIITGNLKFVLDELQNATLSQTEESTDITGKQGRRLNSLKTNKSVTIEGTNGYVSGGLMGIQTGSEFENKLTEVMWVDYLTVNSNTATTQFKAVGTAGSEIENLYIKNADGTIGESFTQGATVSEGKFTYTPNTKTITFNEGDVEDGTEIAVYYKRKIQADVHENFSDHYAGKLMLYIDATGEDKCANIYRVQIFIPKADFSGEFSLEMGDGQTVHAFSATALAGACGTSGGLWKYTVFGANTTDAA